MLEQELVDDDDDVAKESEERLTLEIPERVSVARGKLLEFMVCNGLLGWLQCV